jgi:hypothetical protein
VRQESLDLLQIELFSVQKLFGLLIHR